MEPMVMEAMKEVLRTGQEMERRGLVAGTSGNCSARISDSGLVVITPSSMEYDLLLAEDMCVVNM
ncbi:MAG: class II aldolase/adducin family protein, partial [Actinobacteria bacterium]|nr:class II aldolase/adducin family protein [Actinomycetota bacterium]